VNIIDLSLQYMVRRHNNMWVKNTSEFYIQCIF